MFDYLIVGAGLSGLVVAEQLCAAGKRCLMVDQRNHFGGNCYDYYDQAGVLVHKYGPHYFRTNSSRIIEYLSRFTEWHPVNYKIFSWANGQLWRFPINLNTFEQLIGRPSTSEEMEAWLAKKRIPIENPKNSEEVILAQVGHELYEKFFLGYTKKQWKCHPRELDTSVCGRIPIRTNRDDRYLKEDFQALPKAGYTAMFQRMIDACGEHLEIRLETNYRNLSKEIQYRHMIYTGPIDKFYDSRYGELPYRSLRFEHESFTLAQLRERAKALSSANSQTSGSPPKVSELSSGGFYQPAMQINYPNDHDYTRILEIKHATGQQCDNTTIVREYPEDFSSQNEPYYPVPNDASKALYQKYKGLADAETAVTFTGRLATYRYYNMDQVIGMALKAAEKLKCADLQEKETKVQNRN